MLDKFQNWLEKVQDDAIKWKQDEAKKRGISNWKKVIWRSPMKNEQIKEKFRNEMAALDNNGEQIYFSYPSSVAKTGEWLYDFVSRKLDKNRNFIELFLAMEIELSDPRETEHKRDFNKLLQADSLYKIFVFQLKSEKDVQDAFVKLVEAANKYHFRFDSDFLFCGWSTSENMFFFHKYKAIKPMII